MKIPDIAEIIVAWHRSRNPTEEQKAIAEQRARICDTCEHKKIIDATKTYICGGCGCPIIKKIYSPKGPDACPKQKWII